MGQIFDFSIGEHGALREHTPAELESLTASLQAALASQIATEVPVAVGSATVALGIISAVDGIGFSGVSRVALGRVRFFFDTPQPDANYLAQVTLRNATDASARISSQTATYVEVRTNGAIEAVGFNIKVTRIQRT